jgi:hypothetical protein
MFSADGDVGRHIRVGRNILEQEAIPRSDTLSHTRLGADWMPKEWLSQVTFAAADRATGLAGTATVAALLFTISVLVTYRSTVVLGGSIPVSLSVAAVSLLLQIAHLLPRPHLATTAFAAFLMLLLIRYRQTGRTAWIAGIPPLFVLWANSHGGFPAGLALVALFAVDAWIPGGGPNQAVQRRLLPLVVVLSLLATLVNPAGPELWSHITGHLGSGLFMDITHEFRSPDFHDPLLRPLLLVILGLAFLLGTGRARPPWLGLALLLGSLAATLISVRHIALFATLGLPWVAVGLGLGGDRAADRLSPSAWPEKKISPPDASPDGLSNWILPTIMAAAIILAVNFPFSERARFNPKRFPVTATADIAALPSGPMFNEMEWGGYLLYAQPGLKIFIDGHADFFGESLVREYLQARAGGVGWDQILDKYGVEWTLLRPGAPLNQLLELSADWTRILDDGVAVIYRRDAGVRAAPGTDRRTLVQGLPTAVALSEAIKVGPAEEAKWKHEQPRSEWMPGMSCAVDYNRVELWNR